MNTAIIWEEKKFNLLSLTELYGLMQLRSEVFVVEQNCVYLDADGKDKNAWHILGMQNGEVVACARILAPGTSYAECSIGRVCTHRDVRKVGAGKLLMQKSIVLAKNLYPDIDIKIGAQLYLQNFYNNLGFTQSSEEYLEDGIPHIEMLMLRKN